MLDKPFQIRKPFVFCIKCYQSMFRQRCAECCKPIKRQAMKAEDVFWHSKCFRCFICRVNLTQDYYASTKQHYCTNCFQNEQNDMKRFFEMNFVLPPMIRDGPISSSTSTSSTISPISQRQTLASEQSEQGAIFSLPQAGLSRSSNSLLQPGSTLISVGPSTFKTATANSTIFISKSDVNTVRHSSGESDISPSSI